MHGGDAKLVDLAVPRLVVEVDLGADADALGRVSGGGHVGTELEDAVVVTVDLTGRPVEDGGDELPLARLPVVDDVTLKVRVVLSSAAVNSLLVVVPDHELETELFVPVALCGKNAMVVDVVGDAR